MGPGEIHVYSCSTDLSPAELLHARSSLDGDERDRARRKRIDHDRQSFEVAHALLRIALSSLAPVTPAGWRFEYNADGRPRIAPPFDRHGLSFNLTHTRGLVACAVALRRDLGIDAECVRREAMDPATLKACFTASEIATFRNPADAFVAFTLKEAYLKARGIGLAIDPRAFSVAIEPPLLTVQPPGDSRKWTLARHSPDADHSVAIAVEDRPGQSLEFHYHAGMELRPLATTP